MDRYDINFFLLWPQVQYQNYVNDLIKTIVCHHEEVFSNIEGGVVYEKSIIEDWLVCTSVVVLHRIIVFIFCEVFNILIIETMLLYTRAFGKR